MCLLSCPYLSFTLYFGWSPDSASFTAETVVHSIKWSETLPFMRSMFSCSCSHLHLWPFARVSMFYFVFLFLTGDSLPLSLPPPPLPFFKFTCLSVQCFLNQTFCILLCSLLWPDWLPQRTKNAFCALSLSQCCLLLLVFFFFKFPCVLCCGSVCGDKKRRLDAVKLELQAAVNFPTELRSSGRVASTLHFWTISPAPRIKFDRSSSLMSSWHSEFC